MGCVPAWSRSGVGREPGLAAAPFLRSGLAQHLLGHLGERDAVQAIPPCSLGLPHRCCEGAGPEIALVRQAPAGAVAPDLGAAKGGLVAFDCGDDRQQGDRLRRLGEPVAAVLAVGGRARFDASVLVSPSRESFLRALTGRGIAEIGSATLAAELHAARAGVDFIRTHDVGALRNALVVNEALVGAGAIEEGEDHR